MYIVCFKPYKFIVQPCFIIAPYNLWNKIAFSASGTATRRNEPGLINNRLTNHQVVHCQIVQYAIALGNWWETPAFFRN